MFKEDFSELYIYLGTFTTFISWLFSKWTMDLTKDVITIVVGLSTVVYTIYKILGEISKRKFYKKIEKEKKNNNKKI